MGAKHMKSNSSMAGKVSKTHKMLCKAVDRPSKELQQPSPQNLAATSSNTLDSAASTRVACCRSRRFCTCKSCMEYGRHNEISLKLVQKNEAPEPFSSKKFVGVADQQCKQLLDALGIFNSNKELFINLLQDPNSLLIKHIEDSTDSRDRKQQMRTFFDGRLSENKIREVGEYEEPAYSQNQPCDRLLAEESDDSQSLERIVVLKPNPTSSQHTAVGTNYCSSLLSHSSFINNAQSDKGSFFSFRQIKRKMRQAMRVGRKEGECLSTHGMSKKTPLVCRAPKDVGKQVPEETGKSSYCNIQSDDKGISSSFQDFLKRDKLEKAFYSRNGDKSASTSESTGKKVGQSAVTSHLKQQKSKKHDGDKEVSRKMKAKPWGWVMCFSDDDILPSNNPGCHTAGHMRYSHLSSKKIVYEKKSKPQNEERQSCKTPQMAKVEASSAEIIRRDDDQLHGSNTELNMSHVIFPDVKVNEDLIIEGSVKIIKDIATICQEGNNFCEASYGFDSTCKTSFCQRTNKTNGFGEKENLEPSKLNSPLEVQPSTFSVDTFPSSSSRFQTVEDTNGLHDKEVRPLPDTIHDQLLVDASSYPDITLGTAESSVEVHPINYEEHPCTGLARLQEILNPAIATFNCCGSISQYVLELLQVSKLNWNELSMECHSSAWLRIPFVDKAKVFNSQLCGDCVLLFDYINEVLEDVFDCYIRCSPWLSSYKAHFQAPDKERALYHEVMKHVDWPLLQQQPPQTLEHHFVRDLTRSRTWIDYPTETEETVTLIAESVLKEITIESVVYLGF